MRCFILASSIRTLSNFLPVIQRMQQRGDELHLIWVGISAADQGQDPARLPFKPLISRPAGLGTMKSNDPILDDVAAAIDSLRPDVLLMDDMNHWPSHRISGVARAHERRPLIIAFQHGITQAWNILNEAFVADYYLCFGKRQVWNFDERHWPRVIPVGLPKLDALLQRTPPRGDHVLFMAQLTPSAEVAGPMLQALQQSCSMPVKIRPHPGYMKVYEPLRAEFEFLPITEDPIAQIERCRLFVTPHSTAALEALYLGKEVVLLPSFGLTDFTLFPGIAVDFSAERIVRARKKAQREQAGVERFLSQVCGGRNGGATDKALATIDALLAKHPDPGSRGKLPAAVPATGPDE